MRRDLPPSLAPSIAYGARADLHWRHSRRRHRRQRRHSRRRGHADQRSDELSRETVTNDVGQYNFPAVSARHLHAEDVAHRLQDLREQGPPSSRTQQFITLDVMLEVGALEETDHGHRPVAAHRHVDGLDRRRARPRRRSRSLPAPGRNAFLIGVTVPDGDADRRPAVQPPAGSDQRVARLARRRRHPRQQLPARRRADHRAARPRGAEPDDRSGRGSEGPGPHLRRRDGAHRRRRVQRHREVGHQRVPRLAASTRPVRSGASARTSSSRSRADARKRAACPTPTTACTAAASAGRSAKNRTFFWTATEGYRSQHDAQRTAGLAEPASSATAISRRRRSAARRSALQPVLPRRRRQRQVPGDRHRIACDRRPVHRRRSSRATHPAANPAGFGILGAWPTETIGGADRAATRTATPNAIGDRPDRRRGGHVHAQGRAQVHRHVVAERPVHLQQDRRAGQHDHEADAWYIASQDNFFGPLRRRPHVLVFNNTNIINDTTVLTLRYGWSTWQDSCDKQPFSPGIGIARASARTTLNALARTADDVFPELLFDDDRRRRRLGRRSRPVERAPTRSTATLSKLMGSHSFKVGADMRSSDRRRRPSTDTGELTWAARSTFDSLFTSSNGVGGHELASVLLGVPCRRLRALQPRRGRVVHEVLRRLHPGRLARELEAHAELRPASRARRRPARRSRTGRRSRSIRASRIRSTRSCRRPDSLAGRTLKGGLIFAGVDGAPEEQGDPAAIKVAPRVGITYALSTRHGGSRRLRAVLRAVELQRHASTARSASRASTSLSQSDGDDRRADRDARQPVPGGPAAADRQLARAAHRHRRHDRLRRSEQGRPEGAPVFDRRPARAAGRHGGHGRLHRRDRPRHRLRRHEQRRASTSTRSIPRVARQVFPAPNGSWDAAALRQSVPNPFFGIAGAASSARRATIPRGQLLRPFPQFGDVNVFERTDGGQAAVPRRHLRARQARHRRWWGGRFSYTLSRRRTTSSARTAPTRRGRRCRRTTTTWMPSTASATSTRRTASSWRRSFRFPNRQSQQRDFCSAAGTPRRSSNW